MTEQNQWQNAAWGTPGGSSAEEPPAKDSSSSPANAPTAPAGTSGPTAPAGASSAPAETSSATASAGAAAVPPAHAAATQTAANPYGYAAPVYQTAPAATGSYGPTTAQPQKRRGWIVALVAVILVFLLGAMTIGSCTAVMSSSFGALSSFESSSWSDYVAGDTVGIINIDGTIQYDGTTSSPEGLRAQLDAAEANPDIKAVVLRVNSGGGVATAGEEMSGYVKDFSKPVVVSCASIDASAAYMISSQADYIYTAKTSAIGSIGVIMQTMDLSGLYEKLGITIDNITSADSKDSGAGNRPLTDEERAYYQAQVDQINQVFIDTVAEGRHMPVEDVKKLATGMTFTGIDAVENGLADEIGTLENAVDKACELAGIPAADTVYLQQSSSDLSRLLDIMGQQANGGNAPSSAFKE